MRRPARSVGLGETTPSPASLWMSYRGNTSFRSSPTTIGRAKRRMRCRVSLSASRLRAALEGSGLSVLEQVDLTPTRLGEKETGRTPVIELDDFPLRRHNLQSCLADGRLVARFILAEKRS